jgi:large subunit ribosomal protein L13
MKMKYIDATNLIVGRIATRVAKMALLGEEIIILNSEKAIVTGRKETVFAKYKRLSEMGVPRKGPYLHRSADKLLRRSIRGMLPFKKPRGAEAYKNIKCFVGVPEEFKDVQMESFEDANIAKVPSLHRMDLLTVSKKLGGRL